MFENRLHRLVFWSLIGLNSGAPLPWAHRHADLESSESGLHRQFFHQSDQTIGSTTWHLHFFDPKQPLPEKDREKCPLADFNFICLLESEESSKFYLCHRVKNLGQHAVQRSDVLDLLSGENLASLRDHSHAAPGRQSLASCEQLCSWQI